MFWILVNMLVAVSGFPDDETLTGYAERDAVYELVELDGEAVSVSAFVRFPGRKSMEARSPCFAYSGRLSAPMPWFEFQQADRVAYSCIEQPVEDTFADALAQSTLAEVSGGIIILSDDTGPRLVFQRANH